MENKKLKVLNLYAGIGGNRKLWTDVEVTAVEFNQELADIYKTFYPNDIVIVSDAIQFLQEHWKEFDFIWSSPPCQTHNKMRYLASKRGSYQAKIPDMSIYSQILFLQHFCKDKKWIVENVVPYYKPLIEPTIKLDRHLFWSNFSIENKEFDKPEIKHNKVTGKTDRFGISLQGIKMKHRKDQIIRNCVNPELGLHILNQLNDGNDGIPPNPKVLGILPTIKRTTWSINTKPFKEAHFAVYPEELCETPIRAGCPEGGVVLDPFAGAFTTGVVANRQNKKFIGIELNPEYIEIGRKRLS